VRVLVVGVAGALARRVALLLRQQGHEVLGLDRRPWWDHPKDLEVFETDLRKRAAEDVFRSRRPECVVHMATVNALSADGEERARINVGGTKTLFQYSVRHGVKHVVFVGRHTYYGASAESLLYHTEDEPPQGMGSFPELADLVAADLYAANMLWREPSVATTVLRLVYTLGESQTGTLASYLKSKRVPLVMGFDPLFHALDEHDAARGICAAVEARARGIFNVAGPAPLPLSTIVRETGRTPMPLPEPLIRALLGRFGLPRLPKGAIDHLKYPIVCDSSAFARETGFKHEVGEVELLRRYRRILNESVKVSA
jgi:UDP-glucose 4-epimerase